MTTKRGTHFTAVIVSGFRSRSPGSQSHQSFPMHSGSCEHSAHTHRIMQPAQARWQEGAHRGWRGKYGVFHRPMLAHLCADGMEDSAVLHPGVGLPPCGHVLGHRLVNAVHKLPGRLGQQRVLDLRRCLEVALQCTPRRVLFRQCL